MAFMRMKDQKDRGIGVDRPESVSLFVRGQQAICNRILRVMGRLQKGFAKLECWLAGVARVSVD